MPPRRRPMAPRRPASAVAALVPLAAAAAIAATGPGGAAAADAAPAVVASIRPIHSLVAGVMAGVGEPRLLVRGGGSPHTYQMRPSEARMLDGADVVFYVGEGLETFLDRPLRSLGGDARIVALMAAEGVELLPYREGDAFEAHPHDHDGGHGREEADDHEGHAKAHAADEHDHDGHGHEAAEHGHEAGEHGHEAGEHGHDHAHGGMDAHVWLDPANAGAIVRAVAAELAELDPANRAAYEANAGRVLARLDALDLELRDRLEPVRGVPFMVFHDAYQYLERRYGLNAVGSVTPGPERQPGAQHLREVRARIQELGARCVFSEPQFEPRLVATVIEGTDARAGVLDPEGGATEPGPDAYFDLMRANADALVGCLSHES